MKKYIYIAVNLLLSLVSGAGVTNIAGDNIKPLAYTPLVYSSFLGGPGTDNIVDIQQSGGYLYVLGTSNGTVPVTENAISKVNKGGNDVFLAVFRLVNEVPAELTYSTMLGGSADDMPYKIDVDESGNVYITGSTQSTDLPAGDYQFDNTLGGNTDAFIIVLKPEGEKKFRLQFTTYLGGDGFETPAGIEINDNTLYIAGTTGSNNYPTTEGAFNENPNGEDEVFITSFDFGDISQVKIKYSTYFGGDKSDIASSIHIGDDSKIIIAGNTYSDDLIITQGSFSGMYHYNSTDGFLALINPASGGVVDLVYSCYYGGTGDDYITSTELDTDGNIIIGGYTNSTDLTTTTDAVSPGAIGKIDAFLAKLKPQGGSVSDLLYSTYFGGTSNDRLYSIFTDSAGFVYFSGYTESINFPTVSGAYDRTYNGLKDVFFTKLNITGNIDKTISYSTFAGSNRNETAAVLYPFTDEKFCFAGYTDSKLYPVSGDALDGTFDDKTDGFISVLYIIPLKIKSISSNTLCWGDSLAVEYLAGVYNDDNIFYFELSDSTGKFNKPILLGTLQSQGAGVFKCAVPHSLPYSGKYRLRIRSSSPYNTFSSDSNYITISPLPEVSFDFKGDICYNAPPVKLTGGEPMGGEYSGKGVDNGWFYPTIAGLGNIKVFYTVQNDFGCSNSAMLEINVRELPPTPMITYNNGRLESNIPAGNQWYLDGKEIPGATGNLLVPAKFGDYTVVATNEWGCRSFPSEPYIYNIKGKLPVFAFADENLAAEPGQIVPLKITLRNQNNLKLFGIKKVTARLTFNSTLLEPWYDTPQGYVRDGSRIIEVGMDPDSVGGNIIRELYLRATLGNDTATIIKIDNVTSDMGDFEYEAFPVQFRLLGVCSEGGLRLTGSFGRTELVPPSPNPAESKSLIEFEIVEKGWVQLSLISTTGETAASIVNSFLEPGRMVITQDLSDIPAGSYFLVLKTPGKVRVQRMSIVK